MSPLNVNLSGNCVSFNPIYHKPKPPKNKTPGIKKYGFTNKIKQSLYDTAIYGLIKTKQKNSHFYFILYFSRGIEHCGPFIRRHIKHQTKSEGSGLPKFDSKILIK